MLSWLIEIYLVLVHNGYFNYELSNEWNLILEFHIKSPEKYFGYKYIIVEHIETAVFLDDCRKLGLISFVRRQEDAYIGTRFPSSVIKKLYNTIFS